MGWLRRLLTLVGFDQPHPEPGYVWCIRVNVKRARWENRNSDNQNDVAQAALDLTPAPKDNGGLSVYAVSTDDEARKAAILHEVMYRKPDGPVHYLFIPAACLHHADIRVVHECDENQHPFLRERHRNIYGLAIESVRLEIARALLQHPERRLIPLTKKTLKEEAVAIKQDIQSRSHMVYPDRW